MLWKLRAIALVSTLLVASGPLGSVPEAATLPDGRVYEQVSPPAKNAADVIPNATRVRSSTSGDRVTFASLTGFGDVNGTALSGDYLAERAADGSGRWLTHAITPRQDYTGWFALALYEPNYKAVSPDLSTGVLWTLTPLTDAPNVTTAVNLYRRSDLLSPGPGAYELVTPSVGMQAASNSSNGYAAPVFVGASNDFKRIYFTSRRVLSEDAPSCVALPAQCPPLVYEWADGEVHDVGTLPSEEGGGAAPVAQAGQFGLSDTVVSGDGTRVVYTVPAFEGDRQGAVYEHNDQGTPNVQDDVTVRVNKSERTDCNGDPTCGGDGEPDLLPDPAGAAPAMYWTMSTDGTKIFFTTSEQLTDDDTNSSSDLYMADLSAPAGGRLQRISVDHEPADGLDPNVDGVIGAAANGSAVYFMTSQAQLVAGGPLGGTGNEERIFVWRDGVTHEVGAVRAGAETEAIIGLGGADKAARVSPDGAHLVFITEGSNELLSLYGHSEYSAGTTCPSNTTPECSEVYAYSAVAGGGSPDLQCASCNPTGAAATVDARFGGSFEGIGISPGTPYLNHPLSDDGRFVFFNTAEALVSEDRNGNVDAYEYNTLTGRVHLISDGRDRSEASFLDASPDGHDVFFTTREQLRSSDTDQSRDLYDARIGGSTDPGAPPPHDCTGDDCRSAATPGPSFGVQGSEAFHGGVERLGPDTALPVFSLQALGARERKRLVRTGRGSVELNVAQAGSVNVRVAVRIHGRAHTIQSLSKRLRRGERVRLKIRLTKAARVQLARTHRLGLTISASYSQVSRPQVLHIMLRSRGR